MSIIFVFNAVSHSGGLVGEVGWTIWLQCIIPPVSKENIEQTFQYDQKSQTDRLQEGKACFDQIFRKCIGRKSRNIVVI